MRAHGGRVDLKSSDADGTTVTLRVPRRRPTQVPSSVDESLGQLERSRD